MRNLLVRFLGLRHEVAYIAVEPGSRAQPDDLPSVLYQDMQRGQPCCVKLLGQCSLTRKGGASSVRKERDC